MQKRAKYSPFLLFGIFFTAVIFLTSCDDGRVFEKNNDISNSEWYYEDTISFEVMIVDTLPKNVYINFRHGFQYGWRNAWLKLKTTSPSGEWGEQAINLPLSQPDGHWYGDCSGDICMMRYPIVTGYIFPDTGVYTFQFVQDMRQNPLPEVMSIGLRVEEFIGLEQE